MKKEKGNITGAERVACNSPCETCNSEGYLSNGEICLICGGAGCRDKEICEPAGGLGCEL